jgi:hypothetical protein
VNEPSHQDHTARPSSGLKTAARAFDSLKLDFDTIRTILLSAVVVCVLLSVPFFLILKNFVTFDALDKYLKLTESVRPKILHTISEELGSGYSKNFIFQSTRPIDNTMLFYATKKQRVTLSVNAIAASGPPPKIMLQLNGCKIRESSPEPLHLYEFDLTKRLEECGPDEPNLHTLRIALPDGLPQGATYQVKCLVLVYERVREHIDEK